MANAITNLTIRKMIDQIDKDNIVFNNLVQRNLVWERQRKQLLVHSILQDIPINVMFASKHDGVFDILDGKQRMNTVREFYNNGFRLDNYSPIVVDDEEIDVSGKHFDELPQELQDSFLDYSLTIFTYDNLTEPEEREMLYRLNCGKSMSPIELVRIRMGSIDQIKHLAEHDVFEKILSKSAINKYVNEELVMKWFILGFTENRSLLIKDVRKVFTEAKLSQEQISKLEASLDWLDNLCELLDEDTLHKFCTKTNLVSIYPVVERSRELNNIYGLVEFVTMFFDFTRKERTISEEYNETLKAGSTREDNVRKREKILLGASREFLE